MVVNISTIFIVLLENVSYKVSFLRARSVTRYIASLFIELS